LSRSLIPTEVLYHRLREKARQISGRDCFPRFLRLLLLGHIPGNELVELWFRDGSQVGLPAEDGITNVIGVHVEVPEGRATWEVSVDSRYEDKADSDFNKRLPGADLKKSYVAALPFPWSSKEQWAQKKTALGKWREVRVFDASSIGTIVDASTVNAMPALEYFQLLPSGIIPVSAMAQEYTLSFHACLARDRDRIEAAQADLAGWLSGHDRPLVILAPTVPFACHLIDSVLEGGASGALGIEGAYAIDNIAAYRMIQTECYVDNIVFVPTFFGLQDCHIRARRGRLPMPPIVVPITGSNDSHLHQLRLAGASVIDARRCVFDE